MMWEFVLTEVDAFFPDNARHEVAVPLFSLAKHCKHERITIVILVYVCLIMLRNKGT